ncbi:hypothetical protein Droror1_Dr00011891 [Drosera rotundifolia]
MGGGARPPQMRRCPTMGFWEVPSQAKGGAPPPLAAASSLSGLEGVLIATASSSHHRRLLPLWFVQFSSSSPPPSLVRSVLIAAVFSLSGFIFFNVTCKKTVYPIEK